ncbi:MAG TPA: tetratricopeptide repeat protein [Polyangia bacterium]|nr:tetratricopeptide repeat protein [Polyangia bacterium]
MGTRKKPSGAAPRAADAPPVSLPGWAAVCFFVSGAAGLLYEAVWSKQLSYLLGSSLHAVATVVAAFLGGLALGARFLGQPLSRRPRRLQSYALLELGVAVSAALLVPALRALAPLIGVFYRLFGAGTVGFGLARLLLTVIALIPTAALMGATLPVLVAAFAPGRVGQPLARLYALNTLGAVVGSILGGFFLIPGLGLGATTAVAVVLNLAVGALAWSCARRAAPAPEESADAPAAARPPGDLLAGRTRAVFLALLGLSGFAALAFQIAWVRLFGLVLGSSVYSFSAVLGGYLLGIALGSLALARFGRVRSSLAGFGKLQVALAAAAAVQLFGFARLPGWVFALGESAGTSWTLLYTGELGIVLAFLLVPCALLGAAFPLGAELLQRDSGGQATALAYAVNTVGTIAGSLLAGFLAIPAWGVEGTAIAALACSLLVGVAALALASPARGSRRANLRTAAAALCVTAALVWLAPAWDPALMSAGPFRPNQATYMAKLAGSQGASAVFTATRNDHVLYYREGINSSVIVVGSDDPRGTRTLRVGGKVDASTGDMETQVLLGLIPGALADPGARTMIIGLGSGVTAASALAAGVGPTEIVELEPGVVEASRFFFDTDPSPLDDPRVTLVLDDARTGLAHGGGRYGVIVSEPSNPWIAGVNNLFTADFYRQVRARLEPDGVFCQWLQLYELTPETFATLVRTFTEVFPEGHLFVLWRVSDALLVAAPSGRRLALDRLRTPEVRRLLARAGLARPEALAAEYAAPLSMLAPVGAGAPLNTDDRPLVEYRAPRDMVVVGRSAAVLNEQVRARLPLLETMPPGALFAGWPKDLWFQSRAGALANIGDDARAAAIVRGARASGLPDLADRMAGELEARRRASTVSPFTVGRQLMLNGDAPGARQAFEQAVAIEPTNGLAWVYLADCRQSMDDVDGAESALGHARQSRDPQVLAQAAAVAGAIESKRQQAR